jgi:hypothetical protein
MTQKTRALILFVTGVLLIVLDVGQIYWALNTSLQWMALAGMALGVFAFWCCVQSWRLYHREGISDDPR